MTIEDSHKEQMDEYGCWYCTIAARAVDQSGKIEHGKLSVLFSGKACRRCKTYKDKKRER